MILGPNQMNQVLPDKDYEYYDTSVQPSKVTVLTVVRDIAKGLISYISPALVESIAGSANQELLARFKQAIDTAQKRGVKLSIDLGSVNDAIDRLKQDRDSDKARAEARLDASEETRRTIKAHKDELDRQYDELINPQVTKQNALMAQQVKNQNDLDSLYAAKSKAETEFGVKDSPIVKEAEAAITNSMLI